MAYKSKSKPDYSLITVVFVLVVFGLIVLSSASSVVGYANYGDSYYFLKHQLLYGFLPGLFLFFIFYKINYKSWSKYAVWIFIFTIGLLLLVFAPGIGAEYNSARSWLNLGSVSLQPAEIAKLTFLIFLTTWLAGLKTKLNSYRASLRDIQIQRLRSFWRGLAPFTLFLGLIAGLIILQPDVGTVSIIFMIALGVYFAAGARWSFIVGLVTAAAGLVLVLIKTAPYRLQRLTVFLDPQAEPLGIGYHINQALLAVGSGGFWGLGLGHSRQKFEYLPEVAGDSIFAVIAEELGFIFAAALVLLFVYFVFKILRLAKETTDDFASLFCVGVAVWIGGQALLNIGAMVGILPLTGVPLPFISYGGTALMSVLAASGILVNISKTIDNK